MLASLEVGIDGRTLTIPVKKVKDYICDVMHYIV
jgi:hypothetical protein